MRGDPISGSRPQPVGPLGRRARCHLFADTLVLAHVAFVLFVVLGGLLALRWPRVTWVHVPAAMWGVVVEWADWMCPLTPLEDWLSAGDGGKHNAAGFVARRLVPMLYPAMLTRDVQVALGTLVLVVNVGVYWWVVVRQGSGFRKAFDLHGLRIRL